MGSKFAIIALFLPLTLAICGAAWAAEVPKEVVRIFNAKGCIGCHRVKGIPNAIGLIGPRLDGISRKQYIAGGKLLNTPKNLARWLRNPKAIKSTVMPYSGLTRKEIRILVKFFDTL